MKARKLLRQLKRLRPLGSVQPPGVSCDPLLRFEKPAFVELCLSNPSNHQQHRPILLNAKPCAALTALTLLIAVRPGAARPKNHCPTKCPCERTICSVHWGQIRATRKSRSRSNSVS